MMTLLMIILCPRYLKLRPKEDDEAIYVAEGILHYRSGRRRVVFKRRVVGRRNAYRVARWLGVKVDWTQPEILKGTCLPAWEVRPASLNDHIETM